MASLVILADLANGINVDSIDRMGRCQVSLKVMVDAIPLWTSFAIRTVRSSALPDNIDATFITPPLFPEYWVIWGLSVWETLIHIKINMSTF